MRSVFSSFHGVAKAAGAAIWLLALPGCANLEQYVEEFDARWNTQTAATLESAPGTLAPAPARVSVDAHKKQLAMLTPNSGCPSIYEIAPAILSVDTHDSEAQLKLAACDYQTKDLASARQRYSQVMAQSQDVRALKGLALTEVKDGRYVEAAELLKKANALTHQSDWQIMNALGYAEDQLGHKAEAEAAYSASATLAPTRGAPMNNLGMFYLRQDKYAEAVKAFSIALNREPDLKIADMNRRIAFGVQGQYSKAFSGTSDKERSIIMNSVGAAALAKGDNKTAKRMFRDALNSSPVFYENAYANLERLQLTPP